MLPLNLANPKPSGKQLMVTIAPGWWWEIFFSPTRKAPNNTPLPKNVGRFFSKYVDRKKVLYFLC
jgi:hypothetical protein